MLPREVDGHTNGHVGRRDIKPGGVILKVVGEGGLEPEVRLKHWVIHSALGGSHDHVCWPRMRCGGTNGGKRIDRPHAKTFHHVDHIREKRIPVKVRLGAMQSKEFTAFHIFDQRESHTLTPNPRQSAILVVQPGPLGAVVNEWVNVKVGCRFTVQRAKRAGNQPRNGSRIGCWIHEIENELVDLLVRSLLGK